MEVEVQRKVLVVEMSGEPLTDPDMEEPPEINAESSTSDLERSGAGPYSPGESETLATESVLSRMDETCQDMFRSIKESRELLALIPGADGDGELREEDGAGDDSNSSSDVSEDNNFIPFVAEYRVRPESLLAELWSAEVERYGTEKRLQVAEEKQKCLSPRLNALKAQVRATEQQRQVEAHEREAELRNKNREIDELKQRVRRLEQEKEQLQQCQKEK